MDTLQEQMNLLTTKVEALSQRIEQLSSKVSEVSSECRFGSEQLNRTDRTGYRSYYASSGSDASMEHKDVLMDHDTTDATTRSDRPLAPEIQIQRLTAQLTAAYNRIAALEEQLLSKRIH